MMLTWMKMVVWISGRVMKAARKGSLKWATDGDLVLPTRLLRSIVSRTTGGSYGC